MFALSRLAVLGSICVAMICAATEAFAQEVGAGFGNSAERALISVTDIFGSVLFADIAGMPFLVLWLMAGAVFFTLRLKFINVRLFTHAVKVLKGTYDSPEDPGEVTHFQAFTSAVSATVGIGNIAGVAVAVTTGGPGAVVWMMIAGFFGMSLKYSEVVLGMKYRRVDEKGRISGGAFRYLEDGLAKRGLALPGKILAIIFAVFCITGAIGAGNLFQANQSVELLTGSVAFLSDKAYIPSLILAILVGIVLLGGIRRIATIAEKIVPFMAVIYIIACIYVLYVYREG